jgi:hypothetical protein
MNFLKGQGVNINLLQNNQYIGSQFKKTEEYGGFKGGKIQGGQFHPGIGH